MLQTNIYKMDLYRHFSDVRDVYNCLLDPTSLAKYLLIHNGLRDFTTALTI